MESLLEFLKTNQAAIVTIATIVLAIAALATVWLTVSLIRENRLLRKAGTEPEVVAYLTSNKRYPAMIDFVLANIGQGPARNVDFVVDLDANEIASRRIRIKSDSGRKAMSILPQGESIRAFFARGPDILGDPRLSPFKVEITYENIKGRTRQESFELDVSQFSGLVTLGRLAEHDAAEALKKIENHLHNFATGFKRLKVETITSSEARSEEEENFRELKSMLENDEKDQQEVAKVDKASGG